MTDLPTPDTRRLAAPRPGPEWLLTPGLIPHPEAVAWMEDRVAAIHDGAMRILEEQETSKDRG